MRRRTAAEVVGAREVAVIAMLACVVSIGSAPSSAHPGSSTIDGGAAAADPRGGDLVSGGGHEMLIGPIEGLTEGWHVAPKGTAVPRGSIIAFAVRAPEDAIVTWTGAIEIARSGGLSTAICPLTSAGRVDVAVTVDAGHERTADRCILQVSDVPVADISVRSVTVATGEIEVDPALPPEELNAATMAAYFGPSIAPLRALDEKLYLTSVERPIPMSVTVTPPEFAPLIEWRIDGAPMRLGAAVAPAITRAGTSKISIGPPGAAVDLEVLTYRVDITSHERGEELRQGEPITFVAATDPPGFEHEIAWLSSTKYGTAAPVLGRGPEFTVVFEDTFGVDENGALRQWMGVKAANAVRGQDQKGAVAMLAPEPGAILSETGTELIAEETGGFDLANVQSIRFERSQDGVAWTLIDEQTSLLDEDDEMLVAANGWTARWDTELLPPGDYLLRCTVVPTDAPAFSSDPVPVTVNKEPVPLATFELLDLQGDTALVRFDGTKSIDVDGFVKDWLWDFGDGNSGSGPVIDHLYLGGLEEPKRITLCVTDDKGATVYEYWVTEFFPVFQSVPDCDCICKSITLRGDTLPAEDDALGPDGEAGGSTWPKVAGKADGKTLGPLHDDPENTRAERNYTGYAFEIVVDVNGNPSKCEEIQVIKRTAMDTDDTYHKKWKGRTADLDKDGTDDIDVSTQTKCTDAGGTWDATAMKCSLCFPRSGADFGPDTPEDSDAGGAYESPYSYKKYAKGKIVWFDAPSIGKAWLNGATYKADFVAIIRGTDGKACYVAFTIDCEKKVGQDTETLTQTGSGSNVDDVPNVP